MSGGNSIAIISQTYKNTVQNNENTQKLIILEKELTELENTLNDFMQLPVQQNNTYTLTMLDNWGDGWDASGKWTMSTTDGTIVAGPYTFLSGYRKSVSFVAPNGQYVINCNGGGFPSEAAWTLSNENGKVTGGVAGIYYNIELPLTEGAKKLLPSLYENQLFYNNNENKWPVITSATGRTGNGPFSWFIRFPIENMKDFYGHHITHINFPLNGGAAGRTTVTDLEVGVIKSAITPSWGPGQATLVSKVRVSDDSLAFGGAAGVAFPINIIELNPEVLIDENDGKDIYIYIKGQFSEPEGNVNPAIFHYVNPYLFSDSATVGTNYYSSGIDDPLQSSQVEQYPDGGWDITATISASRVSNRGTKNVAPGVLNRGTKNVAPRVLNRGTKNVAPRVSKPTKLNRVRT